ncbi:hypothetical protein BCV69DRAFT_128562 [Microstroma glucosiphilum]|uniref:Uncharacterized protein n=1 Tax=Pseudomicrostroma glucosiphilum TaxID=1684307 RepID=A0A316TZI9_9BASI|nr:hypothetical protein BCV69DRAFT_128562 [Pseudomicrostroma glucosiphilum]PWN17741.1 hypothetical protein BCV69DRAFT_128562 [Pseudomicrostroma glucosiphilum]
MLVTVNPKEATEPPGLLALSRWPTELVSKVYGTQESLSKAGRMHVFPYQMDPQEWALSSEKNLGPTVARLAYNSGLKPCGSGDALSGPYHQSGHAARPSMPKRLSSSSSSRRPSDRYRVSRPSYSWRPSLQSRPSYHSRPSYSPRPSYKSRPSYQSRPSSRNCPSLTRYEEYFEPQYVPELYEARGCV